MSTQTISRRSPLKQAQFYVSRGLALGKAKHRSRGDGLIHSLRTAQAYQEALTLFCAWIQKHQLGDLRRASDWDVRRYLRERASLVGQKTLDRDRQADQFMLRQTSSGPVKIKRVMSTYTGGRHLARQHRAYTPEQVNAIASRQSARTALATRIAYASGIRAHELLTLQRKNEKPPSRHRTWSPNRFAGRGGVIYTVTGKGGLIREIILPRDLANELENRRLSGPRITVDRKIRYTQYYDVSGGMYFSRIFGATSKEVLGWSTGAHGLRHGYAQDRMTEMLELGFPQALRTELVSQELGHFRPEIVEAYLR